MRVGAIDVGTNSVHLLVADVASNGSFQVVEKQRRQVELGSGGLGKNRLTPKAWLRGMKALTEFAQVCHGFGVAEIYCAATSAVREAQNGSAFCKDVKLTTGIHVRVISGLDEARLIYLGARPHLDYTKGRVLLFDLGGGSTEFILCDAETAHVRASLPVGHIRATESFRSNNPMTAQEVQAIRGATRTALEPLLQRIHPDDIGRVVGTSGTVRCLARMATQARGDDRPEHDDGLVLHAHELQSLIGIMCERSTNRLTSLPGMDNRRKGTLPAGAVIVSEILNILKQSDLVTSDYALRDGLIADWSNKHQPELDDMRLVPDPRRRSVLNTMRRFNVDTSHAKRIARMSLQLFDATAPRHHLRIDDRRLLEFTALLHDIGHHISGEDHHRHGQYILRHTRMSGFTQPEINQMAFIVRHHRGKIARTRDLASLEDESKRRVRILAGMVAIAEALDRGHDANAKLLQVELQGDALKLGVKTRN
ncbi:MAG: exopolyphosphatase/guanosine-5'-triphosphate,3'-diphosphate pyrophosphatase, partial [Kiritimatiellia bacterium]